MKLTSRQDIQAPIAAVYAQITDIAQFERLAVRRGAELERADKLGTPEGGAAVGMTWRARFPFRGKPRKMTVKLAEVVENSHLQATIDSPSLEGTAQMELVSLSPTRTRLTLITDVKPKTLTARLVLQSMRLGKGRVQRRFDQAAAKLAKILEERSRETSA